MRPHQTYVLPSLLVIGIFLSCKKESHPPSPTPIPIPAAPTVYVLGVQDGSVVYWKNGKVNPIYSQSGISYNFGTSSMTTSGNNVYVAGFEPANTSPLFPYMPVFWLNGTATSLADSTGSASNGSANAVAVSGGDVYVAGIRGYDSQKARVPYTSDSAAYPITGSVATVWKNGTPVTLPGLGSVGLVDSGKYTNRFFSDYVSGLFVSGSDVYVAGGTYYQSAAHARYWKNGAAVDLGASLSYTGPNNTNGFPTSTGIYVSGNDVYVSGSQSTTNAEPVAIYWKNGSPVFLSTDSLDGSAATSIAVSGSDVYVAGWQNIGSYSRAMLWKNGAPIVLTGGNVSSIATSVTVVGIDVYVAGYTWVAPGHYIATYWRNGTGITLTDGTTNAMAYSISIE